MSFNFKSNVQYDFPDNRDWIYRPALVNLKSVVDCPEGLLIRNQGKEGACTGFALAAAIEILKNENLNQGQKQGDERFKCSVRMLYEMAQRHDEWAGEAYSGSSLRGVLHGWKHMGVCEEKDWKFYRSPGRAGHLTVDRAKKARLNTIGAYYRLRPEITDMHAALNEVGVVIVSARLHAGWRSCKGPKIEKQTFVKGDGGHAFAIVGYNAAGFWVQNSWGKNWGKEGVALWSYADWIENVMDAWVFRLALPTPSIFGLQPLQSRIRDYGQTQNSKETSPPAPPKRREIAGHFVHLDEGKFLNKGRYWSDFQDVQETVKRLGERHYKHVVMFAHGGLNSATDCAASIAQLKSVFKANEIYPYHILYDTGIAREMKQLIEYQDQCAAIRCQQNPERHDQTMAYLCRRTGQMLWRELHNNARAAFAPDTPGVEVLKSFLDLLLHRESGEMTRFHLIGYSTGALLIGHILRALMRYRVRIDSVSLLAPACSHAFYEKCYRPALDNKGKLRAHKMQVYQLMDALEMSSGILPGLKYRQSLLQLASQAFEPTSDTPLLGLSRYNERLGRGAGSPDFYLSDGMSSTQTRAKTHSDFVFDAVTLNHLLKTILGAQPKQVFSH